MREIRPPAAGGAILLAALMAFASPIWLVGLVPWFAVAVWLFQGRQPQALVPFLALWHSRAPLPQPKRKLQVLPLAVLMALLAALCSILASAGPSIQGMGSGKELHATLIVDRGLTMSAQASGETRYVRMVRTLIDAIPADQRLGTIELIMVPGEAPARTTFADCAGVVAKISPTALDTSRLLTNAVSAQLAATPGPVIVVTDKPIAPRDHLIQIPPEGVVRDVGISLLAARQTPVPQVMVRVRNQSSAGTAQLGVSSDDDSEQKTIQLPAPGQTRDYFFDPPKLGAFISAQIVARDDLSADDRAWLVREGNSARIEPRTTLDPALRRMIEVYQRTRPASDDSQRLPVVSDAAQLPANGPAVWVVAARDNQISGGAQVVGHPVTAHVAWDPLPSAIDVASDPPAGWVPLVSVGGRTIVAVRSDGTRQVWVGFDAPNWSRTPDYVVFWTNVFDFAGGGGTQYVAHPLSDWTAEWKPVEPVASGPGMWPGLYRRSDGALRAFNAPDFVLDSSSPTDWRARLASLRASVGRLDLSNSLLVVAAGCLVMAAILWKSRRRPPSFARATVPQP